MSKLNEYYLCELYKMDSGISTKPEQAGYGAPFISFSTIFNNQILPEELTDLMNTSENEQEKYSVKAGDILLTRTSETLDELAMSSVAIKDYPNATFSGFAKRLRPIQSEITYAKFMAFFMRSDYFRKIINCKAVMTLRASFNEDIFSYIKVKLPDIKHQKKSGDLFYAIEEKIRNNNKIIIELESMEKIIYDYWFLQFEFPNEDGKPYKSSGGKMVMNTELNREIPLDWKVKNLLKIAKWIGGAQPPKSTFVYEEKINYIRFIQNRDYADDSHLTYIPISKSNKLCNKFDIMIDKYGDAGKIRYGIEGAYNVALAKIEVIEINCQEYVRNYLNSELVYKYLHESCIASTRASLNENNLSFLNLVIPDENVLNLYERDAKLLITKILKLKEENQELISLRDFLLPLLINGQVGFKE